MIFKITKFKELVENFLNEEKAIDYLLKNNYINKYEKCEKCNANTILNLNKKLYVCRNYKCRKSISIFYNSLFSKLKIPINDILYILYNFLIKTSNDGLCASTGISRDTIYTYFNMFRSLIFESIDKNIKIGGPGIIVEIDETKIGKKGLWVIGGVERDNRNNIFMEILTERNENKFNDIILKYVYKGSIIYTDTWGYYDKLEKLGFEHKTVDHNKYFKDPITGVHINTIEGKWAIIKLNINKSNRNKKTFEKHLYEYIWRTKNKEKDIWIIFMKLISFKSTSET